jgi:hypothetical protein
MFRVLSDDINNSYCSDKTGIRGMAQALNISNDGLMMRLVDMVGLSNDLKGFTFSQFKGTLIELRRPDDGKIVRAEVVHISDSELGVRYI